EFARSRTWPTDYARIQRQQCIQQAMLSQFDSPTPLTRYETIMEAGEQMVDTSIPRSQVGSFLNRAMTSERQDIARMTVGPPDFDRQFSTYPAFKQIHQRVDELLPDDGTPVSGAYLLQPTLGLYLAGSTSDPEADWEPVPTQPDG